MSKPSDIIAHNNKLKRKLTPEQRDVLIRYHNAVRDIPSTEEMIDTFNVDISKQAVFKAAEVRRNK